MEKNNKPKHGFAAFLSFLFPGLGQLLKKHFLKSFLMFWGMVAIHGIFEYEKKIKAFFHFLVGIYSVYDAYHSNKP